MQGRPNQLTQRKRRTSLNIHTVKHLAFQLGLDQAYILEIARNSQKLYLQFSRTDKTGKQRDYYKAHRELRKVQDCIRERLLGRLSLPIYLKGGVGGESAFTHAKPHLGRKLIVCLDIKDFFPSIRHENIYEIFIKLNCQPNIARILTKLTTADYHLPIGFTTSPFLANLMVNFSFGLRLDKLAKNYKFTYTQFYDDLSISGEAALSQIAATIKTIIRQNGFNINYHKGGLFTPKDRPIITGYQVSEKLTLDRNYRRSLRRLICDCLRDGPSKHVYSYPRPERMKKYGTVDSLQRHLAGRVYRLQIDPVRFKRFKGLFDQIDWSR